MVLLRFMTLYKDLKFRRKKRLIVFEKKHYTHIINNCLVTLSIYYYTPHNKFGRGVLFANIVTIQTFYYK